MTERSAGPIIRAAGLTKRFRRAVKPPGLRGALSHLVRPRHETMTAVDGIDLEIFPGESVAYVGPNGAGKSTTVKLLTGVLVPSEGTVEVCGIEPWRHRIENAFNMGVVFGQRTQLWWDIPVVESFRLLGDIYQLDDATFRHAFDDLVEVLDLQPLLHVPARQLSLGQRMRCDLAASLLHAPPVLYLDEPSIGLDVSVKARFRAFIRAMHRERGLTVMLTSHDLGDIEELCDRLVMIDHGRIVYDGALSEITDRFGWERTLELTLSEPEPTAGSAASDALGHRTGTSVSQPSDTSLRIRYDGRRVTSGELIRDLATAVPMADIDIQEPSAESIIRNLYEGTLRFDDQPEGTA